MATGTPPAAAGQNALVQRGYTQLEWGTEAFGSNFAGHGTYIVTSVRSLQRATTVPCTQGSGLTAVVTQLIDGQDYTISCIEDDGVTPPYAGQIVQLQNVYLGALGNTIPPFGSGTVSSGNFVVENNDFNAERGAYGTRVILARAYVLITAANGGGNPTALNT